MTKSIRKRNISHMLQECQRATAIQILTEPIEQLVYTWLSENYNSIPTHMYVQEGMHIEEYMEYHKMTPQAWLTQFTSFASWKNAYSQFCYQVLAATTGASVPISAFEMDDQVQKQLYGTRSKEVERQQLKNETCPKCKKRSIKFKTEQRRGGDEGSTFIRECTTPSCGFSGPMAS